jgi:hypothetical protein
MRSALVTLSCALGLVISVKSPAGSETFVNVHKHAKK